MAIAWRIQKRMRSPMAAERFALPSARDLDPRLLPAAPAKRPSLETSNV